ncbi:hypothetical protein MRX96_050118 [Rhipicephalus microplus]
MLKNNPSHIYDVLNEAKRELAVGVLKKALPSGDDDTETELFATRNVSSVRVKVQLFNVIHSCTPAETALLTTSESPRRTTNFNPDSFHVHLPYHQLGCHCGQRTHCANALVDVLLTRIDMSLNLPNDVNVHVTVEKFHTSGRI